MGIEIQENFREKRARAIHAMGLVNRLGDHFRVFTPTIKGLEKWFEVKRNEAGTVICDCPEFFSNAATRGFRCEHILAVKHALLVQQEAAVSSLEVNNRSESRVSARGEQERLSSAANDPSPGQDGNAKVMTIEL